MKKKIRRSVLCIIAAAMLTVSGTTFADETENTDTALETEIAEDTVSSSVRETEETITADYDDITEYLVKTGSADGYDIYFKDKDIDDIIWEKNGGKPAKKSEYTEEQKLLGEKISRIKKLGEFTAVDSESKTVCATFDDAKNCDEGKLYVSDAKRFLLYTDSDRKKILKIRRVVSTVDNPFLFSSADGKTLELMDSELKNVLYTYTESRTDGEGKTYFSADKKAFARLSADGKQVEAVYRYCAENDDFRLLADDIFGNIGIENRKTGYIWWSSPAGASRDESASYIMRNELRSSAVLRVGEPAKRSNNTFLRSASDDCRIKCRDITNGIRVTYSFREGFEIPAEYTLEGDHIKASVKIGEIRETSEKTTATELTLLGSFGAASDTEEGYFVVPDGSGALIRFNNHRNSDTNVYSQNVYGNDITAVPASRGTVTEQIYLPVYGIVKGDNALLAVASKGDSNACLTAKVSEQSNSRYNICGFSFILRGTDIFYMSGNNSDKLTVFEGGEIKSDDIEMLYYPITAENADFTDIAARYRKYLIEEKGAAKKTSGGEAGLYVSLYGGTQRKKPVLGVPVTMKQSVTDFEEAGEILTQLKENGADNIIVSYKNWTDDSINHKVDKKSVPSGKLGGKSGFKKLMDMADEYGFSLYPETDSLYFRSGNGYSSFSDTCIRISGAYSRIVSYDMAYGIPDGFRKNMSLLSPSEFSEVLEKTGESCSSSGIEGVSLGKMTSVLYGDYGKKEISRAQSEEIISEGVKNLSETLEKGILAETANAYVIPYAEHITGVPLTSGRFDIFNEDVPFYQAVLHGLVPYSSTALNAEANSGKMLLRAAVTGCLLNYDMIYEETSELKDTEYDRFYYANYSEWTKSAAEAYKKLKPFYEAVSEAELVSYRTENDGSIITAEYSDGTSAAANLNEGTFSFNGNVIYRINDEGGQSDGRQQ